jgi:molecular chaperone GrpE
MSEAERRADAELQDLTDSDRPLKESGTGAAGPASENVPADAAVTKDNEITNGDDGEGAEIRDRELLDAATVAGIPELTELEAVTAQRDEYLDALQRLQADFDNFRKRTRRREEELSSHYVASLVERLLPVLDALEQVVSHATAEGDLAVFNQVAQMLRDTLTKEGLEKIDEPGVAFRPEIHDAVAHVPADEDGEGEDEADAPVVEEVLRTGYSLNGKVLRPAMVKVRG